MRLSFSVTRLGRLQAYRLDSVLTMSRPEGPLHFPNVRWLTSGIGFIRRGYADDGSPVLSEMERYRTVGVKP